MKVLLIIFCLLPFHFILATNNNNHSQSRSERILSKLRTSPRESDSESAKAAGGIQNSGQQIPIDLHQHDLTGNVAVAWVRNYSSGLMPGEAGASDIAVDQAGNVYLCGSSDSMLTGENFTAVKFNSVGIKQWVAHYNGPANEKDDASALAVDNSGNVYVTGRSKGTGSDDDYATVMYNSAGEEQWIARYNGPGNDEDEPQALVLDGNGNIYVTGISYDSSTGYDFATVKYNSSGAEQWVARYNGAVNGPDGGFALAIDDSGNVYVTGMSYSMSADFDFATIKYSPGGVEQWVVRYNGPASSTDRAVALDVDENGNVYVTGSSYGPGTEQERDYATVKYNSEGAEQWVMRYNGPGNHKDDPVALIVHNSGNVIVTGRSRGSETDCDFVTVAYNSAGVEQWVARYDGPGSRDHTMALTVDDAGYVYVTGSSVNEIIGSDFATVKYNAAGVEQWVARYSVPGEADNRPAALAVDHNGNVYVTGEYQLLDSEEQGIVTVMYNPAGVQQWAARYDAANSLMDYVVDMVIAGAGNVYVAGGSHFKDGSSYTTIKYVQSPASIADNSLPAAGNYMLNQNYPNPFNPLTHIGFSIPKPENVRIEVINVLGQTIKTLLNKPVPAGTHILPFNAANLPSGVYFYKIEAGEFHDVKKMILLK